MLLPRTCAGCGRSGTGRRLGGPICSPCRQAAEPVGAIHGVVGLDAVGALHAYQGAVRRAVNAAKTGARPDVLEHFGVELADLARRLAPWPPQSPGSPKLPNLRESPEPPTPEPPTSVMTVSWIPASRAGRAERGYDQGRILARAVGRTLGIPVRRMLIRAGAGSQIGRDREQRLAGPGLRSRGPVQGRILLVDDVLTTGASLRCGATELRAAGAMEVMGLCIAWAASADEIAQSRPLRPIGDLGRSSSAWRGPSGYSSDVNTSANTGS